MMDMNKANIYIRKMDDIIERLKLLEKKVDVLLAYDNKRA
jgi:hypothetical protein